VITSRDSLPPRFNSEAWRGFERVFHAFAPVHTRIAPRTVISMASATPGCLTIARYRDATGTRKLVNTRKPISRFSSVMGCHTKARFVVVSATIRLRNPQSNTHGRNPARKIPMLVKRLRQLERNIQIATMKVTASASPA